MVRDRGGVHIMVDNEDVKITSHTLSTKEGDTTQYVEDEKILKVCLWARFQSWSRVITVCGTIWRIHGFSGECQAIRRLLHRRWDRCGSWYRKITGCRRTVHSCTPLPKRPTITHAAGKSDPWCRGNPGVRWKITTLRN
jgi:hypothetical protein